MSSFSGSGSFTDSKKSGRNQPSRYIVGTLDDMAEMCDAEE